MKDIVFCCGRYNPPTIGHGLIFSKVIELSKNTNLTPMIFLVDGEKTSSNEKNPLSANYRAYLIKKYFSIKAIIVSSAYESFDVMDVMGLNPKILVCGTDRMEQYKRMIGYHGSMCNIHECSRNQLPVSATLARKLAIENNFIEFSKICNLGGDTVEVFNRIRSRYARS